MCGICGIIARPGQEVDASRLQTMNTALAHRGPDESGLRIDGHVGLAMRRLSIIDLSGGHQPMASEDGKTVLVFNGEIYNFQELRSGLQQAGHVFRTASDTEVLLRAYEEYGDACLDRLNGMFAFAIYDRKKDRLLAARDRLGIKPLYYAEAAGTLTFASELNALVRGGVETGGINLAALDAYLSFLFVPAPDTIYAGVHKLRPGEKLVFEKGRLQKESYWRPDFTPDSTWTLGSASERYLELLTDSVRLQRISDVPLGAFLSGGLDSTSVVATLAGMADTPVRTFAIGFDDPKYNELPYARAAAEHFQTEHVEEVMQPDLVDMTPGLAAHFGEPFADSSSVPTWLVSQLARREVTVALSGDGGDELFAGYEWTHRTLQAQRLGRMPAPLRSLIAGGLALVPKSPLAGKLRRFAADAGRDPMVAFRNRHTCFTPEQRAGLYLPEVAEQLAGHAADRFEEHAEAASHFGNPEQYLYHDTMMYLPDDILTKVDRMSMANSLEVRVPLLDHRIVEFAATLPFELKHNRGMSKVLPKHALRDRLPESALEQRKQGFAIPVHRWFREDLRDHFGEVALAPDARLKGLLREEAVTALRDEHLSGKEDSGHRLWALLMLEHWLRYAEATGANVTAPS